MGYGQIKLPVTMEVGCRQGHRKRRHQGSRKRPRRGTDGALECPIALTQQDRHLVPVIVDYSQVRLPIAIEVAYRDMRRKQSCFVVNGGLERAVAFSQKYRDHN